MLTEMTKAILDLCGQPLVQELVKSHSDMRLFRFVPFTGLTKKQEWYKVCAFVQIKMCTN